MAARLIFASIQDTQSAWGPKVAHFNGHMVSSEQDDSKAMLADSALKEVAVSSCQNIWNDFGSGFYQGGSRGVNGHPGVCAALSASPRQIFRSPHGEAIGLATFAKVAPTTDSQVQGANCVMPMGVVHEFLAQASVESAPKRFQRVTSGSKPVPDQN